MKHMSTRDTLSAFSEWLDAEGFVDSKLLHKTHEDLATEFIQHWEADERRALLAGRQPETGAEAVGLSTPVVTPQIVHDLLLLAAPTMEVCARVAGYGVGLISNWPKATQEVVATWASAVHLRASDNDVTIPPIPRILLSELDWPVSNADRPHSRACGIRKHDHGSGCHPNCPTCGARP